MATLFFLDGFEHGRAVSGVTGVHDAITASPSIVTSPVRTGLRSLEISAAAAIENVQYTITAGNRIVTMAFYIRFATVPTGTGTLTLASLSPNGSFLINLNTGKFRVQNGISGADGPTPVADTWYRVVTEIDSSGANRIIRATIDGGTEFSVTDAAAAADVTAVSLGTKSAQTYTAYYDDWLISVTDGDYEEMTGWTSHQIESLIPNADGTHSGFNSGDFDSFTGTAFTTATSNGYTFIAHRPLQAANTADQVIRQDISATSGYMEFTNENVADNTKAVAGVRTYATLVQSTGTGSSPKEAQLLLADDTEVLTTGTLSAIDTTADPGTTLTIYKRMTVAPSGGWDGTKVDGLKWRIGFGDGAPDDNFVDLMVEVAQYVPPVSLGFTSVIVAGV